MCCLRVGVLGTGVVEPLVAVEAVEAVERFRGRRLRDGLGAVEARLAVELVSVVSAFISGAGVPRWAGASLVMALRAIVYVSGGGNCGIAGEVSRCVVCVAERGRDSLFYYALLAALSPAVLLVLFGPPC